VGAADESPLETAGTWTGCETRTASWQVLRDLLEQVGRRSRIERDLDRDLTPDPLPGVLEAVPGAGTIRPCSSHVQKLPITLPSSWTGRLGSLLSLYSSIRPKAP
jgi:hypothetical protein